MRGFFVGRFQPFHRGHFHFTEEISTEVNEVIVGIGSAQESHTRRNPFTAGERVSMVTRALEPIDVTTYVIPIEDIDRNSVWVSHIESMCPPFDIVYSNNPLVTRLFQERGIEVRGISLFERDRYSGTRIRGLILEGEDWKHLVPDPVSDTIDEINGVERLRHVSESDY